MIKSTKEHKNAFYVLTGMLGIYCLVGKILSKKIHEKRSVKERKQQDNPQKRNTENNLDKAVDIVDRNQLAEKIGTLKTAQMYFNTSNNTKKIWKICITGGPCGGKTTGLAYLAEKLREEGYNVLLVPEAATLIANGGGMINLSTFSEQQIIHFQGNLMYIQMALEDCFQNIGLLNKKQETVILCDRGLMDGSAYMGKDLWQMMLNDYELNEVQIRDKRYDSVVHLVTAADGKPQFYNQDNNARYEDLEGAQVQDRKTQNAWIAHPMLTIIDNMSVENFQQKLLKMYRTVQKALGKEVFETKTYKRYLLNTGEQLFVKIDSSISCSRFIIEDTYLKYEKKDEKAVFQKIRKRYHGDNYMYLWTVKTVQSGQEISTKKKIDFKEYNMLMKHVDELRQSIKKQRDTFYYEGHQFIIDTFMNIFQGFSTLKIKGQLIDEIVQNKLPPFLEIVREISNDQAYKARYLSKKNWWIPGDDEQVIKTRKLSN